ncbi:MAG: DUF2971 domain-containing protein [Flavobacteriales bacterium]|nr:DUF2971 domain-containing protein [Flavobacteriales bacterium]
MNELNDPKLLFKYSKINKNTIESISKNKLFFSDIKGLNDDFECRFKIESFQLNDNLITNFYTNIQHKLYGWERQKSIDRLNSLENNSNMKDYIFTVDVEDSLNYLIKEYYGVCSFSKDNNNSIMWGNYADSSKGVCMVFDEDLFDINPHPNLNPIKVTYSDDVPKINVRPKGTTIEYEILPAITYKTQGWSDEKEYRAVFNFSKLFLDFQNAKRTMDSVGKAFRLIPYNPKSLKGIIFGSKCEKTEMDRVLSIFSSPNNPLNNNIQFYKAKPNKFSGKYRYDKIDLENDAGFFAPFFI